MDVRVLQYGVTRERLRDVLEEGEGWDVIHSAGHGAPGELVLETEDGSPDPVTAAELADLLDAGPGAGQAGDGVGVLVGSADRWPSSGGCLSCPRRTILRRRRLRRDWPVEPRPVSWNRGGSAGWRRPGALATELAERLGCAVLAMRYPVVDDFAIALAAKLYDLLAGKGQPLPRALGIALRDRAVIADPPTAGCPALSVGTPALFGARAVGLRLAAPQRSGPVSYDTEIAEAGGVPAAAGPVRRADRGDGAGQSLH